LVRGCVCRVGSSRVAVACVGGGAGEAEGRGGAEGGAYGDMGARALRHRMGRHNYNITSIRRYISLIQIDL
jgi:hypothetical protein